MHPQPVDESFPLDHVSLLILFKYIFFVLIIGTIYHLNVFAGHHQEAPNNTRAKTISPRVSRFHLILLKLWSISFYSYLIMPNTHLMKCPTVSVRTSRPRVPQVQWLGNAVGYHILVIVRRDLTLYHRSTVSQWEGLVEPSEAFFSICPQMSTQGNTQMKTN